MTAITSLPAGPVLTQPRLASLPLVAGHHLVRAHLTPTPFNDYEIFADLDIVTAVYLITDVNSRIRWLGQVSRDAGLAARLAEHHRDPHKQAVFATVRALQLHDHTPPQVLDAIEGDCADRLNLRSIMAPRRWPSSGAQLYGVA